MIDAEDRDQLASDLAIPITQFAGLVCGMRKITGASGDEWDRWVTCLEDPLNEMGSVFEAVLDGEGAYARVIDGRKLLEPHGSPDALRQAIVDRIQAVVIQEGRPGERLSPDGLLWSSDARRIADEVLGLLGIAGSTR